MERMPAQHHRVTEVALPTETSVTRIYSSTDLADAFAIELPAGATNDPEQLARFIFAQQPPWVHGLMVVRDAIVSLFGLKTAKQLSAVELQQRTQRVGIFKVYDTKPNEIVLGEDDKHLDFRVSLLCADPKAGKRELVLSTVVHCHNRLGRAYIFAIAPFHRIVVQGSLRRAARIGWPAATPV
jgi:hypothetical protein